MECIFSDDDNVGMVCHKDEVTEVNFFVALDPSNDAGENGLNVGGTNEGKSEARTKGDFVGVARDDFATWSSHT